MHRFAARCLCLALAAAAPLAEARAREIVRFEDLEDGDLEGQVFRLSRPLALHVTCEGAGDGEEDEMFAYGWILDARTRQVAWALGPKTARARGRSFVFDGDVRLPAGDYVAYYAGYGMWRTKRKIIKIFGKEIGRVEIDNDRHRRRPRDARRWGMRIETRSEGDAGAVTNLSSSGTADERVVAQMVGLGDGDFEQRSFELPERMRLTVYCLGEYDEGPEAMADFGWILNAQTRQRVWELGPDNFRHAGGAAKNKMARETIDLPAGGYVVYYSCDGSHSSGAWNAPPPYDPDFWGITVWAQSEEQARRVRPFEDDEAARTLVALVRQRDGVYVTQGLKLRRPTQVRVYVVGERSDDGEFVDQGWISEWKTGRRVWQMSERNTRPAGGGPINTMANETVTLPAGEYVVGFTTDQRHSYRDWVQPPPYDPAHWGITVTAPGSSFDRSHFELFDPEAREESGREFLVRLVRVRNDEHRTQRFELQRPTRVHIVAVGEGLDREMYDYGWIEKADDGTWVWEMTGRNTRHAGGAEKNRVFEGDVLLDRGRYEAHFMTDGSHAWGDWNAKRPTSPHLWGLTLTVAEDPKPD